MFPRTFKTVIDINVDTNAHMRNLNISVVSFTHREILHQSYHHIKIICIKLRVYSIFH